ncbi:hypothetical protein WS84_19600 [Burkholderia anthina]|nr:hypothetical protein WS84_19600 [Burkholderia anthina]
MRGIVAAYEQDRATRSAQETFGYAAEEQPTNTASSVRADYGEIDRTIDDIALQPFGDILAEFSFNDFRLAVDGRMRDGPFRTSQYCRTIAPDLVEQCVRVHSTGVRDQKRFVDSKNGEQTRTARSGNLQALFERLIR